MENVSCYGKRWVLLDDATAALGAAAAAAKAQGGNAPQTIGGALFQLEQGNPWAGAPIAQIDGKWYADAGGVQSAIDAMGGHGEDMPSTIREGLEASFQSGEK